jgi:hypothetical protein
MVGIPTVARSTVSLHHQAGVTVARARALPDIGTYAQAPYRCIIKQA